MSKAQNKVDVSYAKMYTAILADKLLSPYDKIVYAAVYEHVFDHDAETNDSFPSVATIAENCAISPRQASRSLSALANRKLIVRKKRKNKSGDWTSSRTVFMRLSDVYSQDDLPKHLRGKVEVDILDDEGGTDQCAVPTDQQTVPTVQLAKEEETVNKKKEEDKDIYPSKDDHPLLGKLSLFSQDKKFRKRFPELLARWKEKYPGMDVEAAIVDCDDYWYAIYDKIPAKFSPGGRISTWLKNNSKPKPWQQKKPSPPALPEFKPSERVEVTEDMLSEKERLRKELDEANSEAPF